MRHNFWGLLEFGALYECTACTPAGTALYTREELSSEFIATDGNPGIASEHSTASNGNPGGRSTASGHGNPGGAGR